MEATDASRLVRVVLVSYQEYSLTLSLVAPKGGRSRESKGSAGGESFFGALGGAAVTEAAVDCSVLNR